MTGISPVLGSVTSKARAYAYERSIHIEGVDQPAEATTGAREVRISRDVIVEPKPTEIAQSSWRSWLMVQFRRLQATKYFLDGVAGLLIAVLSWPVAATAAGADIDSSWVAGLHVAAHERLSFGSDIAFTFGPLGFMGFPQPYYGWTSTLALVFVGVVHFAACATMFHLARTAAGRPMAFPLVFGVSYAFPWIAGWVLYGVLVFTAATAAVLVRTERQTGTLFAVLIGAAVGLAGLGKLNIAAVSLVVAGVAVIVTARERRRSLGAFVGSAGAAFLALWLVTGQSIADVPAYVRAAIEVSTGYSESMGIVDASLKWGIPVAALAVAIVAGMLWQRSAGLGRLDRVVLWILFGIIVFASFKAGIARGGVAIFLATLLAIWPVFSQRAASWTAVYVPVAGLFASFIAVLAMPVNSLIAPVQRVNYLESEVSTVLTGRASGAAQTEASLRSQFDLPSQAIDLLSGRTVDIEPWAAAAAYAYPEIDWRPQPVFQAYAAYTPYLDQLNADFLASDTAPDRMLWLSPAGGSLSIDWRNFWFDAPAAKVEMLCRYVPLASTSTWQVLGRVADRCSTPITVATITAAAGDPVKVPVNLPPGIVTVRVTGVGKDLLTRLLTVAFTMPPWYLTEDQVQGRLPPGTASDPLVLGSTTDVGYEDALALQAPPGAITVGPARGAVGFGSPLTLEFQVWPVARP